MLESSFWTHAKTYITSLIACKWSYGEQIDPAQSLQWSVHGRGFSDRERGGCAVDIEMATLRGRNFNFVRRINEI